jgi:thiol-disulfide isomerase/thioredoxin
MRRFLQLPKPLRYALAVCLLTGLGLTFFPAQSHSQLPVIKFVGNPDPAPGFKAKDLNGNDINLQSFKGKVVLLNFWATWCGPCRAEIPDLVHLQTVYKERLQIIGMAVDVEDESELRSVVKKESINYPIVVTTPEVRMAYGGITALPTVFVVNPEGKVVQKHVGLFNPVLYETEVRALLDLAVAARIETFEDTGEVFLKHADRATMLPGVNTSSLTPEQRLLALHKFNAESCTCGCKFTLAQCRIYDPACQISKDRTAAIVKEVGSGQEKAQPQTPARPDTPATPSAPATPSPAPAPSS